MSSGSPHLVTRAEELEAIIGRTPDLVRMKQLAALDDGCERVLAAAPIAGLGFCDAAGRPHTTVVGGEAGFVRVDSPRRISLRLPADGPVPADHGGVSFVFLLPGIGETLRLNGSVATRSRTRLAVDVEEAYVHCARCILRSRLWGDDRPPAAVVPVAGAGPLADPAILGLLASAPFLVLSSRDAGGGGDTSPRGDQPGFVQVLDGRTLAVPDRRGNRRADTLHNVLADPRISAAVLVPGRTDVLHLTGTAAVTDDPALLAGMALGGRAPQTALLITVEQAQVRPNAALRAARVWDRSAQVDKTTLPDLMALGGQHLASTGSGGAKGRAVRLLMKPLGAFPRLTRRLIDLGYRRQLRSEGYPPDRTGAPGTERGRADPG